MALSPTDSGHRVSLSVLHLLWNKDEVAELLKGLREITGDSMSAVAGAQGGLLSATTAPPTWATASRVTPFPLPLTQWFSNIFKTSIPWELLSKARSDSDLLSQKWGRTQRSVLINLPRD